MKKQLCYLLAACLLGGLLSGCGAPGNRAAAAATPPPTASPVATPAVTPAATATPAGPAGEPGSSPAEESSATGAAAPVSPAPDADGSDTVDLTTLSSTMIYAEVYNMLTAPEEYIGKTVKMRGQFEAYKANPQNEYGVLYYFAVVIPDATACCQQGIEFVLQNADALYPDDYPKVGTEVTVTGTFQPYQEGDASYCHLVDAVIA